MTLRRRLAWSTGMSMFSSVIMVLLGYPRNWIMARSLGPEQFGTISLAGTIVGWSGTVFALGLHYSVVKFAVEHIDQPELLRGGVKWTVTVGLLASCAGGALLALLGLPLSSQLFHQPELGPIIVILSVGIPLTVLMNIASSVNVGLGQVKYQVLVNNIFLPTVWTALVCGVSVFRLGITAMAWTMPLSLLVAAALAYALCFKTMGRGSSKMPNNAHHSILSVGVMLFVSSIAYTVWLQMGTLFLGMFSGPRQVGLYTPAYQTSYTLTYLIVAVSSFFSPTVASLLANNSLASLRVLYIETTRWCYYGNMLIAVTFFVCAAPFLALFGSSFATAETALTLRILLSFFLLYSLTGAMPAVLLGMGGHHKKLAIVDFSLIPVTVILHLVFTRSLGIVGAAMATGLALATVGVLRSIVVKRNLGFWGVERAMWRGVVVLAVTLACGQCTYTLALSLPAILRFVLVFVTAGLAEVSMLLVLRDPTAMDIQRRLRQKFAVGAC